MNPKHYEGTARTQKSSLTKKRNTVIRRGGVAARALLSVVLAFGLSIGPDISGAYGGGSLSTPNALAPEAGGPPSASNAPSSGSPLPQEGALGSTPGTASEPPAPADAPTDAPTASGSPKQDSPNADATANNTTDTTANNANNANNATDAPTPNGSAAHVPTSIDPNALSTSANAVAPFAPFALGSVALQISTDNWYAVASNFNATVEATVPEGSTGNLLTVHLPRYVTLAQHIEPNASKGIVAVNVTGSSADPAGTTIDVTLADSASVATRGLDIYLSQQDFIESAREATTGYTYDITAEYSYTGAPSPVEATKSFAPDVWCNQLVMTTGTNMANLTDIDFGISDNWRPIVYLDAKINVTDELANLFGEVRVPASSLGVFDVDAGATIDPVTGELVVPYNLTNVDPLNGEPKRFKVEMPLKVNLQKMVDRYAGLTVSNSSLGFEPVAKTSSGKTITRSGDVLKMSLPAITRGVGSLNQIPTRTASYQEEINALWIEDDRSVEVPFSWRIWKPKTIDNDSSTGFRFATAERDSMLSDCEMSFSLPDGVEWMGTASYYDAKARQVTLPLAVGNAIGSDETGGFILSVADGSLPRFRALDPAGKIAPTFKITNFVLSYTYNGVRVTMPDVFSPDWGNHSYLSLTPPLGKSNRVVDYKYYDSESGASDSVLYELALLKYESYDRDIYPHAYAADVDPTFFPVSAIRFNQENLTYLRTGGKTASFVYTTTVHSEERTAPMSTDLVLPADEYLTSWRLSFPDGLDKGACSRVTADKVIVSFQGRAPDITQNSVEKTTNISLIDLRTNEEAEYVRPLSLQSRILRPILVENLIENITSETIHYEDASRITVTMRKGTSEEAAALPDGRYSVEWDLPQHLRITDLGKSENSFVHQVVYETNLNPTPRTYSRLEKSLYLREGEYITALKTIHDLERYDWYRDLTFKAVIDPDYTMTGDEEWDSITARVVAASNTAAQEYSYDRIKLNRKPLVSLGMKDTLNAVTWAPGGPVTAETDFEVTYEPTFRIVDKGLTDAAARAIKVANPTFYFEVPRYTTYVQGSFKVNGVSKRPSVTRVAGSSSETAYIKVEFSGDVNGPSGAELSVALPTIYNPQALSFSLHVEDFAPAGIQFVKPVMYADLSKALVSLRSQDMDADNHSGAWVRPGDQYGTATLETIAVGSSSERVFVSRSRSGINLNILQYRSAIFSAKVNTDDDATLRSNVTVVDGQPMSAFLDIVNNASDISDLVVYVPVAREGRNDGSGVAQWSIQLASAVLNGSAASVSVEYSTNANPTMAELTQGAKDVGGMYLSPSKVADHSQVTMVKLKVPSLPTGKNLAMTANFKSLGSKTVLGDLTNRVAARYAYNSGGTAWIQGTTAEVDLTLTDTVVSGKIWNDANADGKMDASEGGLSNVRLGLHAQDGSSLGEVRSGADGTYSLVKSSVPAGAYLEVEKPAYKTLTFQSAADVDKAFASLFDQATYRVNLVAGNTAHINAGFVDAQELAFNPQTYTVRKGKTAPLAWTIDPATPARTLTFASSDEAVAMVDAAGLVTGVSEGTAELFGSFVNDVGITVSAKASVTVERNNAPAISGPSTAVELNAGDAWDPRSISIVPGLAVIDDHDTLGVNDLLVSGDSLFATGGKAVSPGTYAVTYNVSDSDGNAATAFSITVKVHGLPYLADKAGAAFGPAGPPIRYIRTDGGFDPFSDVSAYWLAASDTVGAPPTLREISPGTSNLGGTFQLRDTRYEDGTPTPSVNGAGKYQGTYYLETPKKGVAEVNHKVHARGALTLSANSISVPASALTTRFNTFAEFKAMYGTQLGLASSIEVINESGSGTSIVNLTDSVDVVGDMARNDFSLTSGQTSKELRLTLTVTDSTTAATYGDKTKTLDIIVTVAKAVGAPPTILFDPLENPLRRIASDTVQENPVEGDPALPDSELYDKLLHDANMSDSDGTVDARAIIGCTVMKGGAGVGTVDVNSGASLRRMLTTPGEYELIYRAVDDKNNTVTATRLITVASATRFVTDYNTLAQADAPATLSFRQRAAGSYSAAGEVTAYHIDSDGVTLHPLPLTSSDSADLTQVGVSVVKAESKHHYEFWPATMLPRPLDSLTQTVLVHGPIQFAGTTADVETFVGEPVSLTGVSASFRCAVAALGGAPATVVDESLTVTKDVADDQITAVNAGKRSVTYSAHDGVSNADAGNDVSLVRTVSFYGLPEVTVPVGPVAVRTGATADEIRQAVGATARIALPDGTFENMTDKLVMDVSAVGVRGGTARFSVDYTVAGVTKTGTADVTIEVSAPPAITASDITLNVGDTLDILAQSNVAISDDRDTLTTADLSVNASVPVDIDGKVTTPATYAVEFSVDDAQGNHTVATINVRVNGLPVIIGAFDMVARVGDSLSAWNNITVSWLKAPDAPGAATPETFAYGDDQSKGTITLTNYRRVEPSGETSVDTSALNVAGLYKGDFVATTPTKGTTSETHTLKLHGNPRISVNSITVAKGEANPVDGADFMARHTADLGIVAKTKHVADNGAVTDVDMLAANIVELDISGITFGVNGVYKMKVRALDQAPGVDAREVSATANVTIATFSGVPPVVNTHTVQRVSTDPIRKMTGQTLADYVLSTRFVEVIKKEHDLGQTIIEKIEKICGPSLANPDALIDPAAPESLDANNSGTFDETELNTLFTTVGTYHITYGVTDSDFNKVSGVATLDVAGPTEFGYGPGDQFTPVQDIHQIRQTTGGKWSPTGIVVRHRDMDGRYHLVPLDPIDDSSGAFDLDNVGVLNVLLTAVHHRDTYEDGTARPHDEKRIKVLVQGRVTIKGADVPCVLYQGDTLDACAGLSASYLHVNEAGVIAEENVPVVGATSQPSTSAVGLFSTEVSATEITSGAADASDTKIRQVAVNGVPQLQFTSSVVVPTGATENQVKNALGASASYVHAADLLPRDITAAIEMDLAALDTSRAGETLKLDLRLPYTLDPPGSRRAVENYAFITIDAPPTYTATTNDFSVGDAFDPLAGLTFSDKEDGTLDAATSVTVKSNIVDTTTAGTYKVVYTVSDSGGNVVDCDRIVRVHGRPTITGAPAYLAARVGSLPTNPLAGVSASYLKAGDTVGAPPADVAIQPALPKGVLSLFALPNVLATMGGLAFGNLTDSAGASVATIASPGLYEGVYTAESPYGAKTTVATKVLAHSLPALTSTGMELPKNDTTTLDIARLMANAGLTATVKHAASNGSVSDNSLPASAFSIVSSNVDVTTPGTYAVRVSVLDATAPAVTKEADVEVRVVNNDAPVITANDIVLNVGDGLNVLTQSGASVADDYTALTVADITVASTVPADADGKVTTPGTTAVELSALDAQGHQGTKTINVRVNGLPVIAGASDRAVREGDALVAWDQITVSWMKAPNTPGPATLETFKYGDPVAKGVLKLDNYRRVAPDGETTVNDSALRTAGLYKVDYVATTPSRGAVVETHTIKVHGLPTVSLKSLAVAETEATPVDGATFMAAHAHNLGIEAKTKHVSDDGTVAEVDLLRLGKVSLDISSIKFGVKGTYDLTALALDEAAGVADKTVTATAKVTIDTFNGVPPAVSTHTVQRVSSDPVLKASGQTFGAYLLADRFVEVAKKDYDIASVTVEKVEKVSGFSLSNSNELIADGFPETVDRDGNGLDESELDASFNTVGAYRITYAVTDKVHNKVAATATLFVTGPTEFGRMENGQFVSLGSAVDANQEKGADWTPAGIVARHADADGTQHTVPLDAGVVAPQGTSLEHAATLPVVMSAGHHNATYEDGVTPRPHDTVDLLVRVQGTPTIKGAPAYLVARVGSLPANPLAGVTASYLKAGDNAGDAPAPIVLSTPGLMQLYAATMGGLVFGNLTNGSGAGVNEFAAPGLYKGTYTAENPYGGTTTDTVGVLAHGNPQITSTTLELLAGDTSPIDIDRLVAEAGLEATVKHATPNGTVIDEKLPATAFGIVSNGVNAARPGTYVVRVSAKDATAPEATVEADVQVVVKDAAAPKPNPNPDSNSGGGTDGKGANSDSSGATTLPVWLAATGDTLSLKGLVTVCGLAAFGMILALGVILRRRRKE